MKWSPGDRCHIAKGGLRGQCGTIVRMMAVKVLVKADNGKQAALMPSSLMPIEQPPPPPKPRTPAPEPADADVELFSDLPPPLPKPPRSRRKKEAKLAGTLETPEDHTPPLGARKGWTRYVRRAHRGSELEARMARPGDVIDKGFKLVEKVVEGNMLCRNPRNDHRWQMPVAAFNELYVKERARV